MRLALAGSALLVIGLSPQGQEWRLIHRLLIHTAGSRLRRKVNVMVALPPQEHAEQELIEKRLNVDNFFIYLGNREDFTDELIRRWHDYQERKVLKNAGLLEDILVEFSRRCLGARYVTSNTDVASQHSRNSAGRLSPEPGTYGSGSACPATPTGTAFPAASLIPATTVSVTVSATRGCPTIGAPHPRAHPSRNGNLRRELTTPHLHPPTLQPVRQATRRRANAHLGTSEFTAKSRPRRRMARTDKPNQEHDPRPRIRS